MRAFAISCWLPNRSYERQTLSCIRSIRLAGHTEDIFVLTIDQSLRDRIGERDWKVLSFPEISYDGLHDMSPGKLLARSDAQKLYFWSLPEEYRKVFCMDCDVLVNRDCGDIFQRPVVSFLHWHNGGIPLLAGQFLYRPNNEDFQGLMNLVKSGFNKELGWNNHGPFEWKGKIYPWDFQAASTAQGYLFYYFNFVKKNLSYYNFYSCVTHYAGKRHKFCKPESELYTTNINRLIGCL